MQKKFEMFSEQFNEKLNSSPIPAHTSSFKNKTRNSLRNLKFRFKNRKKYPVIIVGIALIVVLIGSVVITRSLIGSTINEDERLTPPEAIASQEVNKEFTFPIMDEAGEEVARISYMLQSANLQDEFIYQGQVASAVKGRTFLIFDLKIENPFTKTIEVNARDYIRVKVNGSEEQLAPEIHNDPVQIQAKSTKFTRIGLPINDADENIIVLIGEIEGEKQEVKLNLSR